MTTINEKTNERLLSIHCPSCGGPAEFDIVNQRYVCAYCGGFVSISEAIAEKRGFRKLQQEKLKDKQKEFKLEQRSCPKCGAKLIFPKGEALSTCSFCDNSLVRGNYLKTDEFPELVIPFRITLEEAKKEIKDWCKKNSTKKEAKHILSNLDKTEGYYLPYELVRGPLTARVSRVDTAATLKVKGFLEGSFVNTSSQLDNLVLNGMEPFDLEDLNEFDFSYIAGQRVKINDMEDKQLSARINREIASDYTKTVRKVLETKHVYIFPESEELLTMPLLLPVYFITTRNIAVAVNGQTGKVAVRSEKLRYPMPWWIKPIIATLLVFIVSFAGVWFFIDNTINSGLYGAAPLTLVMGLIFYTAYSNAYSGTFRFALPQEIFTSKKKPLIRKNDTLVEGEKELEPKVNEPVFYETINGKPTAVTVSYSSPVRMAKILALCFGILLLPLILAFIFNGFRFSGIEVGGSAVWMCVMVPVIPAYYVQYGRIGIYENPELFVTLENGRRKRVYKETPEQLASARKMYLIIGGVLLAIASFFAWLCLIL